VRNLRTVVSICLASCHPIEIWWGPDYLREPGYKLRGVEGEIKQVLSNLLANAIDAFYGDAGTIRIRTRFIDGHVRLLVADTGRGIPPQALARIWEPFFTTKESLGTGLSLWVTREILTKHKARLRLRTSIGPHRHGTTFVIDFPIREQSPSFEPSHSGEAAATIA